MNDKIKLNIITAQELLYMKFDESGRLIKSDKTDKLRNYLESKIEHAMNEYIEENIDSIVEEMLKPFTVSENTEILGLKLLIDGDE